MDRQRSKPHTFIPTDEFEKKKNAAIMIHKICNIIQSQRSEQFVNHCKNYLKYINFRV